jgi:hypothetical protein
LSGNAADTQARQRQIARRWAHSCVAGDLFERQNVAAGRRSALTGSWLSAFGTAARIPAPVVMQKIHILTDY